MDTKSLNTIIHIHFYLYIFYIVSMKLSVLTFIIICSFYFSIHRKTEENMHYYYPENYLKRQLYQFILFYCK